MIDPETGLIGGKILMLGSITEGKASPVKVFSFFLSFFYNISCHKLNRAAFPENIWFMMLLGNAAQHQTGQ